MARKSIIKNEKDKLEINAIVGEMDERGKFDVHKAITTKGKMVEEKTTKEINETNSIKSKEEKEHEI